MHMPLYSTDCIATQRFRPHGRVEISLYDEGVIKYLATGPFNKELAEALAKIDNMALHNFSQLFSHWGELVVFEESCMALDDALYLLERHLIDKKQRKTAQLASAFIFKPEIQGRRVMDKKYERCYKNAGIAYKSFNDEISALAWVQEQFSLFTR